MSKPNKCDDAECICQDDSIELRCPDPECVCNHQPAWCPPGHTNKGGAFTRKGHPEIYAAMANLKPSEGEFKLPDYRDHVVFQHAHGSPDEGRRYVVPGEPPRWNPTFSDVEHFHATGQWPEGKEPQ